MDVLRAKDAREMLLFVADEIIAAKPMLTEVDSATGDGDHGIGMAGGLKKAKDKLIGMQETEDVYALFQAAGKAMLMSMGGASGVIFGSLFLAGAKDQTPACETGAPELAALFERSLAAIQERGKAQPGDKTMVDALAPAVQAMKSHCADGLERMFGQAELAAFAGMESTKNMEAKFGRAKTQASTIGFQDAGATSVWIIMKAMHQYVREH